MRATFEQEAPATRRDEVAVDMAVVVLLGASVVSFDGRDGGAALCEAAELVRALLRPAPRQRPPGGGAHASSH